jgi:tRNA-specific 2-thiouridylase
VAKDTAQNIVYISSRYYDTDKSRDLIQVENITWLSGLPSEQSGNYQVKVRHGELFYDAFVTFLDDAKTRGVVKLPCSDQGLAAGQFVVFYQGDYCLGAGVIAG